MEGLDQVPQDSGFLACSNHVSYIDWLLMGAPLKNPYRFVGDHSYIPDRLRWFFLGVGTIPIASAKEDKNVLKDGLLSISENLIEGHAVGFHPEAYMTRTGYLQPIRRGVELIVADSKAPVVPVYIEGMWGSFFSRKYGRKMGKGEWSFRRKVHLKFGKPIGHENFTKELLEQKLVDLGATREADMGLNSREVALQSESVLPP